MNPKPITTLFLGIVAALCLATQCEKEPPLPLDQLPPETQEGKNTFGCYVNGELFVINPNAIMFAPSRTVYNRETKVLDIFANTGTWTGQQMRLFVHNPREGENTFSTAFFSRSGTHLCFGFACEECGFIYITKFDTLARIVSGTFEFIGRCVSEFNLNQIEKPLNYLSDSIIHITEGRFDIKFNIE